MEAVGLDAFKGGWIAVVTSADRFSEARSFGALTEVIAAYPDAAVIAVDMPIGLPAKGRRAADVAAKRRLGRRASTVFYTPPRDVMDSPTYESANALSKRRHGIGVSKQSYALRPKVLEADAVVRAGSALFEVHPEVAFADIAGAPLPSKRTYHGLRMRESLLRTAGLDIPDELGEAGAVPMDDVLDAAVVAVVAGRIGRAEARPLPEPPEPDEHGIPMAIWV